MPRVPIDNLGTAGLIVDRPPHTLAPEAWSSARNIRFQDGKALRIRGHKSVFETAPTGIKWAMPAPSPSTYFWLVATLGKVHAWNGTSYTDISKAATTYAATDQLLWNGGLLGGVPVLNNGVDPPQQWDPKQTSQLLVDLANWPVGYTAQVMRPFGNFLVALDINDGTNRFEHMVKWSHPADPGTVPVSWDHTDATRDAGENELTDVQAGGLREAWPLGNSLMLYKAGSVWSMRHVRGILIFEFQKVFETIGALATNCVKVVPRAGAHFVLTNDDIVVHDGVRAQSILDSRYRRHLSNLIDTDNYERSFVVANVAKDEMWACVPTKGSDWPDRAVVWNQRDNTISERDLPDTSFISLGVVNEVPAGETWDAQTTTWEAETEPWGQTTAARQEFDLLMVDHTNSKLFLVDEGQTFDGTAIDAQLERTGLAIVGRNRSNEPQVDFTQRKLIRRIWPKATGGPFDVRIGAQEVEGGPVSWGPAQTFTPGTDRYLDPPVPKSGLLMAVRFESMNSNSQWSLAGYDIEVEVLGLK